MPSLAPLESPFAAALAGIRRAMEGLQMIETDIRQYEAEWRELAKRHNGEAEAAGLDRLHAPPHDDSLPWDRQPTSGNAARARQEAAQATERAPVATGRRTISPTPRGVRGATDGKAWRKG